MLLADRFTYIHEPKTGGTFVTHVMKRVHGGLVDIRPTRTRGPLLSRLGFPTAAFYAERQRAQRPAAGNHFQKYGRLYNWNDHGTCSEIPLPYRRKPIVAAVRNPFETYVSLYLFGWWRRPESIALFERIVPGFASRYPDFPELSFKEYLELAHAECTVPSSRVLEAGAGVGYLTERFVRFYFRLPRVPRERERELTKVVGRIDDAYAEDGRCRRDMYDVRFIHTSRLNEELRRLLLEHGYDEADVDFVARHEHVIPVGGTRVAHAERSTSHDWRRYYTPELLAIVRSKDRLIFTLFPEFKLPAASS